ncbi:MAG: thioredoxin family protein [Oscillospiraceae bacterium]|nr:thioredoxin family protein [Oscillospiraceae bacterium]
MTFPDKSPLIAPALEEQLKTLFSKLNADVELICIAGDDPKSAEMGAFLNHLSSLSPLLRLRFLKPGDEPALDNALDAALLPATAVGGSRMVFHGVPGGKEITAFAGAILNAGGAAKPLDRFTAKDIAKIQAPMKLQVCVSLACQHCSQLVLHAQRIAWENELVTAHMIDANLYPEMVQRLNLQRVPLTVVNGNKQFPGGKTMAELTGLLSKYRD